MLFRSGGDALVARLPQAVALEQHPDPLSALGRVVEPPVESEVLERGQLPVDERLVGEEADPRAIDVDVELARRRREEAGEEREERRLSRSVRPRNHEAVALV